MMAKQFSVSDAAGKRLTQVVEVYTGEIRAHLGDICEYAVVNTAAVAKVQRGHAVHLSTV